MQKFLPDLIFHQDEPLADPVCVPLYYVSKLARDTGTIVVQVGEGADEIFAGYDWFRKYVRINELFWRQAEKMPVSLRHSLAALAKPLMEASFNKRTAIELARRLGADEPLFWGGAIVFDEDFQAPSSVERIKRSALNGLSSYQAVEKHLEHIAAARPDSDFAARMTYLELKLRLPELLLMRVDKMTMATSVEARVPFLDHHLMEYAMSLAGGFEDQRHNWQTHFEARAGESFAGGFALSAEARFWRAHTRMVSRALAVKSLAR